MSLNNNFFQVPYVRISKANISISDAYFEKRN